MMRAKFVLLPLLWTLPLAAQGGDQEVPEYLRFEVFNACRPMSVFADLSGDSAAIAALGLTKEDLRTVGKSRVQSARLYVGLGGALSAVMDGDVVARRKHTIHDFNNKGYLSVDVHITPHAHSISVSYSKRLTDEFQSARHAKTFEAESRAWNIRKISMERKNIMEEVSRLLDMFLDLYLFANEAACESR